MWFFKYHIQYLGHVISAKGIAVDLEKINTIMQCPIPNNIAYSVMYVTSKLL